MADFMTELRERRVLPTIGVYVAGCWVAVEIVDRLAERYSLSSYLPDIVFWGLFTLIPAVSLVAWSYGRPGKDKATRAQKVGVPLNLLATAILLFSVFGHRDLGFQPSVAPATPGAGTATPAEVVEAEEIARQRLAVFFFENESGDAELDWLQYAAAELLTQDLQQDRSLSTMSPYSSQRGGIFGRLEADGFEDGLGAPAALLRDIARDAHRQYFINGDIRAENDSLAVDVNLWETASMRRVETITVTGWDILAMMDEASVRVRQLIESTTLDDPNQEDLPLAETYGESEVALKAYVDGINARLLDNDIAAALAHMDRTLETDPNFVLAMFFKGVFLMETGNMPAAAEVLTDAQPLDYRLPANDRAALTAMIYRTTGQTDRLMDFLRLQVQLQDDAVWHAQLATLLLVNGNTREARTHFETALRKDPLNAGLLLVLSDIDRSLGDMDGALDHARRYREARPDEMDAHIKLGDLLRDTGKLDQARVEYQQAQLLENRAVAPLLALQIITARQGDYEQSRRLLEEAKRIAGTAGEHYAVHMAAHYLEYRLGRIDAAFEQLRAAEPHLAASQPPFVVALTIHAAMMELALSRHDGALAESVVAEAHTLLPDPPMNGFLEPMSAIIDAFNGNPDQAREHLARFETLLTQMKYEGMNFQIPLISGEIAFLEGDFAAAAPLIQAAIEQMDSSFVAGQINAYAKPLLLAHLAALQAHADLLESAQLTLDQGYALDPTHPMLWLAEATLEDRRGNTARARELANRVLSALAEADPDLTSLAEARAIANPGGGDNAGT